MKSFIKYYGGKYELSKKLISMIPKHNNYIECFCGASWLLFKKPLSNVEIINDIDNELINLYFVIKYQIQEFLEEFKNIIVSEKLFNILQDQKGIPFADLNEKLLKEKGIPKLAMVTYYNIMNSFNGNISKNNSFAISKNRNSSFVKFYKTNWDIVTQRLKEVTILSRDYKNLIQFYDSNNSFFYLDPPYYVATDRNYYYKNTFREKDHQELLVYLKQLEGQFILNYDNVKKIKNMYKDFNIIEYENELIITNYEVPENSYYPCREGIPITPGESIPKKAPYGIPNCPYCGSRKIQNVSKRITIQNNKRNWKTCGFICNDCKELFKFEIGIPSEDLQKVYQNDQKGIPYGDER